METFPDRSKNEIQCKNAKKDFLEWQYAQSTHLNTACDSVFSVNILMRSICKWLLLLHKDISTPSINLIAAGPRQIIS